MLIITIGHLTRPITSLDELNVPKKYGRVYADNGVTGQKIVMLYIAKSINNNLVMGFKYDDGTDGEGFLNFSALDHLDYFNLTDSEINQVDKMVMRVWRKLKRDKTII